MQKLLTFFQQKYWQIQYINVWKFNETLTNDVVSFEQPGPEVKNVLFFQIANCFKFEKEMGN